MNRPCSDKAGFLVGGGLQRGVVLEALAALKSSRSRVDGCPVPDHGHGDIKCLSSMIRKEGGMRTKK